MDLSFQRSCFGVKSFWREEIIEWLPILALSSLLFSAVLFSIRVEIQRVTDNQGGHSMNLSSKHVVYR